MYPSTNIYNPSLSQFVPPNSYYDSSRPYYNYPPSTYQHSVPLLTKQLRDATISSIEDSLSNQIENLHTYIRNQFILTPFNHESLYEIQTHFSSQLAVLNSYRNNINHPIASPTYYYEQADNIHKRFMDDDYYSKCQLLISNSYKQLSMLPKTQQAKCTSPIIYNSQTSKSTSAGNAIKLSPVPMCTSTPKPKRKTALEHHKTKISSVATSIMNTWYESHEEHPYPDHDTCIALAKAGYVQVEQVKKWFANKRMRSSNTKSLRDIAARRLGRKRRSNSNYMEIKKKMKME